MRLALAQINTTVGDLDGNRDRIVARLAEARDAGADLVLFPELAVTGYPPEDLLLRARLRPRSRAGDARRGRAGRDAASRRSSARRSPTATSTTRARLRRRRGRRLSTASGCCRTTASSTRSATSSRAEVAAPPAAASALVGLTVCEDMWQPGPPAVDSAAAGARSARQPLRVTVPRRQGRGARGDVRSAGTRHVCCARVLQRRRRPGRARLRRPLVRARRRGRGRRAGRRGSRRHCSSSTWRRGACRRASPTPLGRARRRCGSRSSSGSRDYVEKNGFGEVVVGISGGIDSALTAALAARRSGPTACTASRCRPASRRRRTRADAAARRRVARHRLPRDLRSRRSSTRSRTAWPELRRRASAT